MSVSIIQPSFSRGEVGPEIAARTDLSAYQTALAKCINSVISPYGGILNRPGTEFLSESKDSEKARLIRFKFNSSDAYALEFTHLKMRVYRNGGLVLSGGVPFELVTPYTRDEIFSLNYTQSADVMDIVHPNHKPHKLKRFDHDNWTIGAVSFVPGVAAPASASAVYTGGGSGVSAPWRYQITAVIDEADKIEESLPVTSNSITVYLNAPYASVSWAAVPGATYYYVYKDNAGAGIYGFIGRATTTSFTDVNIGPTKTDTPPTGEDPFVGAGNYPGAVGYYQQRICYAGTDNKPQTMWFSKAGALQNFGYSFPLKDDDAITWTMASTEVNRINHLMPLVSLLTFTDGAEWVIEGATTGLTPKTINGRPEGYNGIGPLRPLVIENNAVYVQERGRRVSAMGYSQDADGFASDEISILSPHLLQEFSIIDWAFQRLPYSIIWGVRSDGQMLGITFVPSQQVVGWHRHVTDGKVISVCTVPEGRIDAVYLCVERVIGGVVKRYVERMADRQLPRDMGEPVIDLSWFVDCGLRYNGTNTTSETMTLTGGISWEYPEALTLTSSNAARFVVGDVGDHIQFKAAGAQVLRLEITGFTSGAVVTVRPLGKVLEGFRNTAITSWAMARNVFSGLSHLEGREVVALADGAVLRGLTVTGGAVDIGAPGAIVLVGLPYQSEVQTLEVTVQNSETLADKKKIIKQVTAQLLESRGGWYGRSASDSDLMEFKPRQESDDYGPIQPITGTATQLITDGWSGNGQVTIVQKDPLPLNILSIVPSFDVGGVK